MESHGWEVWCVLWDINFICSTGERIGEDGFDPYTGNPDYIMFNNFISEMDLIDLPLLDRSFTR